MIDKKLRFLRNEISSSNVFSVCLCCSSFWTQSSSIHIFSDCWLQRVTKQQPNYLNFIIWETSSFCRFINLPEQIVLQLLNSEQNYWHWIENLQKKKKNQEKQSIHQPVHYEWTKVGFGNFFFFKKNWPKKNSRISILSFHISFATSIDFQIFLVTQPWWSMMMNNRF